MLLLPLLLRTDAPDLLKKRMSNSKISSMNWKEHKLRSRHLEVVDEKKTCVPGAAVRKIGKDIEDVVFDRKSMDWM